MLNRTITRVTRGLARSQLPILSSLALKRLIIEKTKGIEDRLLPTQLALETVNYCTASCVICPYLRMKRPKGVMTMEVFYKVLDTVQAAGAPIKLITHAGIGEPLIDKHLAERIRYERKVFPDACLMIYTNASILTRERARELIDAGVDKISISLNGFRKETYEAVMQLDYERTIENVHGLLKLRRDMDSKLQVQISCVPAEQCSSEELLEFRQYWTGKVDNVVIPPWVNWMGMFNGNSPKFQLPCRYIWSILLVNWDGTVIMCCEDYDGKYPLGNLTKQSLMDVFNGPIITKLRKNQLKGNFDTPPVCKGCLETSMSVVGRYWTGLAGLEVAK